MGLIIEWSLHARRHGTLRRTCWRSRRQSAESCVVPVWSRSWLILLTVYFLSSHHIYHSRCDVKTGHCDSTGKDGQYGVKHRMEADVPWKNWGCKPDGQSGRLCTKRSALSDSIMWSCMLLHYLGLSCPTCKAFMLALALQKAFLGCEQIPSLKYHVAAITIGDLGWGFGKIKCCSTDMCILELLW